MTDEPVLLCNDRNGVRTLTLNRPHRKNAINVDLWIALHDALVAAAKDREVRAPVITGLAERSARVPTSQLSMTAIPPTRCVC